MNKNSLIRLFVLVVMVVLILVINNMGVFAEEKIQYYGYTIPETYRENHNRFGHFDYESYPIYTSLADENGDATGDKQIAYCFNLTRSMPSTQTAYKYERVYYSKVPASEKVFNEYCDRLGNINNAKINILNVLYKGFIQKWTMIQEKYNLNEKNSDI